MKYKIKHLKSVLNNANIPTNTCKDKRDLAELLLRNRSKFNIKIPISTSSSSSSSNNSQQQQQPKRSSRSSANNSGSSNNFTNQNPFTNFMSNVQDFVNTNLNSVLNNSVPCPAPPPRPANNSSSSNRSYSSTSTSTNANGPNVTGGFLDVLGDQLPNFTQNIFNINSNTNNNNNNNNSSSYPNNSRSSSQPSNTQLNESYTDSQTSFSTNTANNSNSNPTFSTLNNPSTQPPQPSTTTTNNTTSAQQSNIDSETARKRRASLSDIKAESDIEGLSIRQIKEILATNFVEYKGCCERQELLDKLRRLYHSDKENKRIEAELNNAQSSSTSSSIPSNNSNSTTTTTTTSGVGSSSSGNGGASVNENDVCKICMESLIDCVLLDCGHMVACIKCGKKLAECPICRQNVVRVVRVFKS